MARLLDRAGKLIIAIAHTPTLTRQACSFDIARGPSVVSTVNLLAVCEVGRALRLTIPWSKTRKTRRPGVARNVPKYIVSWCCPLPQDQPLENGYRAGGRCRGCTQFARQINPDRNLPPSKVPGPVLPCATSKALKPTMQCSMVIFSHESFNSPPHLWNPPSSGPLRLLNPVTTSSHGPPPSLSLRLEGPLLPVPPRSRLLPGPTSRPCAVPTLISILADAAEHPMVRHEAGEASGAIATAACLPRCGPPLTTRVSRWLKRASWRCNACTTLLAPLRVMKT